MTINDFITQTAIHYEKKKPSLDICYLRDKKDSAALAIEKANGQRAEQRLRYRWPVRFSKGVNETTSPGQIVDVSSRGLAMLCHADKHCPAQDKLVKVDFGVPHFNSVDSLDAVFFNRIGRVCRIDNLSSMVNRVAVLFAEPLFFKPGEQNISESDAQQRLVAKTRSITRAEEKAKVYSEALAITEEKLQSYAESNARTEERVKIEAKARAQAEEKVRLESQIRANLEAQMQEEIQSYTNQIARIKAEATEAIIWAKAEAEEKLTAEIEARYKSEAKLMVEAQENTRAYAQAKARAEERANIEARARATAEEKIRAEIQIRAKLEEKMQARIKSYTDQIAKFKAEATEAVIWANAEAEYTGAKVKNDLKQKQDIYAKANIGADEIVKTKVKARTKAIIVIVAILLVGTLSRFYPKLRDKSVDFHNRGSLYLRMNEYEQAIFNYTKAIEMAPKMAKAYYNRGNAYIAKGQFDNAILDYTKAIEINPGFTEAYYDRGLNYAMKGEYDRAILDYNKAIEMAPKMAKAYYNRGNAYITQGQYDQTILDYTKAIEINPRLDSAYHNRALAYYDKGEYDKAWQDIHKAESLGCEIQPGFLEDLRRASGRVK
ncbi:MAG: tetratricopeptide repeat protein [Planctomycetota bacterium]|jgi:tetratricopeptide (TPR) repeat protein